MSHHGITSKNATDNPMNIPCCLPPALLLAIPRRGDAIPVFTAAFPDGATFFGSKGWVSLRHEGAEARNPQWLRSKQREGGKRVIYRNNGCASLAESVRESTPSISPIEDAVRSDTFAHLSRPAIKSGQ